jgi:predicted aconitase with swiveling domain
MEREFLGRIILGGEVTGEALVTHTGFNSLAVFYKSMVTNSKKAICSDQNNLELYGKDLTDKVICLPNTIGSTSAGATWDRVTYMGIAPKAMLFSKQIDSLGAAGLILADQWVGTHIVALDQLGDGFLNFVKEGDRITIYNNGLVKILRFPCGISEDVP